MRATYKQFILLSLGAILLAVLPVNLPAQLFDYHTQESPATSWNGTTPWDARMLATGGVSLFGSAPFSGSLNPALSVDAAKPVFAGTLDYLSYQAFQYWGINQGILVAPDPRQDTHSQPGGLACAFKIKGLRLSGGWYLAHRLALPDFDIDESTWRYTGDFSGKENVFFAAAAIQPAPNFNLGLKLAFVSGSRDLLLDEYFKYNTTEGESYLLNQRIESHQISYLAPTLGIAWDLTPGWKVSAYFTYPFQGEADRQLELIFDNLYTPPIQEFNEAVDTLYRPARLALGASYSRGAGGNVPRGRRFMMAAEALYTFWSGYQFDYFGETLPRDLRNTLTLGLGLEYGFLDVKRNFYLRAGYRCDPQPLKNPAYNLHALSTGLGLRTGKLAVDLGLAYYFGSFQGVDLRHFLLNGTFSIRL